MEGPVAPVAPKGLGGGNEGWIFPRYRQEKKIENSCVFTTLKFVDTVLNNQKFITEEQSKDIMAC